MVWIGFCDWFRYWLYDCRADVEKRGTAARMDRFPFDLYDARYKINEEVKRELANIIRELKDTRIPLMTSVVTVNVTNDLRYAKAYISVMGDEETKKKAMQGLKSAAGFIRRELGKRIDLRYTPEFVFELDDSIEHGANIERLLNNINKK